MLNFFFWGGRPHSTNHPSGGVVGRMTHNITVGEGGVFHFNMWKILINKFITKRTHGEGGGGGPNVLTRITDLHVVAGRRKPLEEEDRAGGQLNRNQGHQHPAGSVERLQEGRGGYDAGSFGNLAKQIRVEILSWKETLRRILNKGGYRWAESWVLKSLRTYHLLKKNLVDPKQLI